MHTTTHAPLDTTNSLSAFAETFAGKSFFAVAATGLMALAAHISLPLPFSPVPLILTPFAVLLIGMVLGPVTAFAAMVLYLAEGATGLPVFSPQGPGGFAQLLGPTAGYLFAYPFAAATAGWMVRNLRSITSPMVRGLVGGSGAVAVIFTFGAIWLATLLHLHASAAWHMAVAPFLPGEIVKIVAAATLYSTMHRHQQA